ncbi:hypothetical protein GOV03_04530 [Candidatus Woesearchaeota archaeon]|nr:hypothetical protein [Candidatus Woesearchaeota archaeon]
MVELYEECQRIEAEADAETEIARDVVRALGEIKGLDTDIARLEDIAVPDLLVETSERIPPEPLEQIALDSSTEQYEQQLDSYAELKTHYQALLSEEARLSKKYRKEIRKAQKYAAKQVKKDKKHLQKLLYQFEQEDIVEGKEGIQVKLNALFQAEQRHFLNYLIDEHPNKYQQDFRDCYNPLLPFLHFSTAGTVHQKIILDELQLDPQERKVFEQYQSEKDDLELIINKKLGKHPKRTDLNLGGATLIISAFSSLGFIGIAALVHEIFEITPPELVIPLVFGPALMTTLGIVSGMYFSTHPQYKARKQAKQDLNKLKAETIKILAKTR